MPTALDVKSATDDDGGAKDAVNDNITAPPADDNVEKKDEGTSITETDDVSPNEKEAAVEKEKRADGNDGDDDDEKKPAAKKVESSNDKKGDGEFCIFICARAERGHNILGCCALSVQKLRRKNSCLECA